MIYPRQTVYSLEALGFMATQPRGKSIKVRELAGELKIPRHFLGKVLTHLVKKDYVSSTKGPSGGFVLTVNPSEVTLFSILSDLNAMEKLEKTCVMGLSDCSHSHPCALHTHWEEFKRDAIDRSQQLTLADFSKLLVDKKNNTVKQAAAVAN